MDDVVGGKEVQQDDLIKGKYYKIVSVPLVNVPVPVLTYRGKFVEFINNGIDESVYFDDLNSPFNGKPVRAFRTIMNGQLRWRYYEIPQFSQPGGRRKIKKTRINRKRTKRRRTTRRRIH